MKLEPNDKSPIGADISEVDLRHLTEEQFKSIYDAWLKYAVLRFREQQLTDDDLKNFSKRFGPLEYAPQGFISNKARDQLQNPYVAVISNIIEDGRPIGGLSHVETSWHTDMSYIDLPPKASLLYAIEVPDTGGDTSFCCMRTCLKNLPDDLAERMPQLRIKHDAAHDSIGKLRRGHQEFSSPKDAPGCTHPAIKRHPETQEDALFLGRRQNAYVEGLTEPESESLLDEIWQYVALPEHTWTQEWKQGDLVIWDNRVVMHRRSSFENDERRLMRRTQVREI